MVYRSFLTDCLWVQTAGLAVEYVQDSGLRASLKQALTEARRQMSAVSQQTAPERAAAAVKWLSERGHADPDIAAAACGAFSEY